MNYIAKFNPYDMTEEVIMAVATGRKKILTEVLTILEDNLISEEGQQHLLVWGPRGMGKSFFLKYLCIQFKQNPVFVNSKFVLLPEEQSNINYPSDLLNMILNQLETGGTEEVISSWEETEEEWNTAYRKFKTYCDNQKEKNQSFSLVVVLENLNEFLQKIKKDKLAQSRFRSLLENQKHFTLIGASPHAKIDSDYNQRLFKAFKEFKLNPWTEEDYFEYFNRRWDLHQKTLQVPREETLKQLHINKLKAISKFTGGSPRIAVVLTDLLLDEDVFSTANTLYGLIDDLTPYYQDLTKSIRPQSRKLFDTLIRLGENISQSEIAKKLNTTQNQISKPFRWLLENGYIEGKKRKGSKSFHYRVRDRIYVLYYQRREIYHNQNYTHIWLLSDFLLSFFQAGELKKRAIDSLKEKPSRDATDLAKISLLAFGYTQDNLPKLEKAKDWLDVLEEPKVIMLPKLIQEILQQFEGVSILETPEEIPITKESIFKEFGDAIIYKEQSEDRAAGFNMAMTILYGLQERKKEINVPLSLSHLFAGFLEKKTSNELLYDISEEALTIFPEPDTQVVIKVVLHVLEFLRKDKDEGFLETLSPDEAIAVQAIVEEAEL